MEDKVSENGLNSDSRVDESGLGSLMVLARYHELAIDPPQIRQRFQNHDEKLGSLDIVKALRELGLKSRMEKISWEKLEKFRVPVILELNNDHYCIAGKVGSDKALIQVPGKNQSKEYGRREIEELWTGNVIIAARRMTDDLDETGFNIRWFFQAIKKYRHIAREVIAASFFVQLFALVTPLMFQIIIDKVLMHQSMSTLDVLVFALVVVTLFEVLLNGLRTYALSHTTNRIDVELGVKLFRHLVSLPLSYFESRRVGDTVARVRELETVRNFITGSAMTLMLDLVFTLLFLAVMFYYSPILTGIIVATLPLYFIVSFVITPLLRGKLDDKFNKNSENQSFLVETVGGIETIKNSSAEPQLQRHWEDRMANYVSTAFSSGKMSNLTSQLTTLISKGSIVLVLWFGAKLVMSGELTVGQLIAFNMLAARVNAPILRIAQIWQEFQQMRVSMSRLADILDAPAEPVFTPGRTFPSKLEGHIRFDHVSFRYRQDGPEVLSDISFDIEAGKVIGIVGSSGSGKSTLVKLIQRLYVPTRGRVLVDGMDLALLDASWLRRQIGVVGQDSSLFNRSVRDNIALAMPGANGDKIMNAAKLAGAHEFILELPDGYDTVIGERGSMLSAGQRQRIAIARALINDPRLLILDEATSALDYESEQKIQKNMKKICQGRTVVIVAHRLSTVRIADRIMTIENGRLLEQGGHEELVTSGGRYAELFRIQEGSYELA